MATLPELVALRRAARGLAPGRSRKTRVPIAGPYSSVCRGRGLEFEEVRAYRPGDDVRSIDWRVTARTGRVHSKLFRDDRERPLWMFVDVGPSMRFGTRQAFKSVAAVRAGALLAWAAQRAGDRVGGLVVSAAEVRSFAPRAREPHLLALLIAMARATAAVGDAPALSTARGLSRLREKARAGSRVVLLSDFYGLDDEGRVHLKDLARRCDVTSVLVYDALEAEAPPAGRYRMSDGQQVRAISTHAERWRREYAGRFGDRREALRQLAIQHRMELLSLRTDDDPAVVLGAALRPREASGRSPR